jgi:hypothetical protein
MRIKAPFFFQTPRSRFGWKGIAADYQIWWLWMLRGRSTPDCEILTYRFTHYNANGKPCGRIEAS